MKVTRVPSFEYWIGRDRGTVADFVEIFRVIRIVSTIIICSLLVDVVLVVLRFPAINVCMTVASALKIDELHVNRRILNDVLLDVLYKNLSRCI